MGFTSIWHWLLVLLIVVLIFGTKKLKNVGKDLGTAVHDFKEGLNQGAQDEQTDTANKSSTDENTDKSV